jgi:hypothetical protein
LFPFCDHFGNDAKNVKEMTQKKRKRKDGKKNKSKISKIFASALPLSSAIFFRLSRSFLRQNSPLRRTLFLNGMAPHGGVIAPMRGEMPF